jgi:hypothetical protein
MNLIRNVTSIKRMLIFATVLSASATPAFAGQTWVSGNVQVRFLMESLLAAPSSSHMSADVRRGALRGTKNAQGLTVQAYGRSWFGIPYLKATRTTNSRGGATLRYRARRGERIRLRISTDSSLARTQPSILLGGIFGKAHAAEYELGWRDRHRTSYTRVITLGSGAGRIQKAVAIQDAAHRTNAFARQVYAGVFSPNKIAYTHPHGSSKTLFVNLIDIGDGTWNRDPEVVMHETAHTYWMKVLPIWNWGGIAQHSMNKELDDPVQALSEGFADYFAGWAGNAYATSHGIWADSRFGTWPLERRGGRGSSYWIERLPKWGERNEGNIMCVLWDLTDNNRDSLGILPGTDRVQGGDNAGLKTLLNAVKAVRYTFRLSMLKLYHRSLCRTYGRHTAEVMTMNGIPVR